MYKCPECNKRLAYIRIKSGEGVCHNCGITVEVSEITKQKEERKKKNVDK